MALPYTYTQEVFPVGTALTGTVAIVSNAAHSAGSMVLQVDTTGFTGTIDIQGRAMPAGAWKNLMYGATAAGGAVPAVAQLTYTTDTAVYQYVVFKPMPYMRVVMTRSAGSLGAWAFTYSEPIAGGTAAGAVTGTVAITPSNGTLTNRSGTIATGGTAQQLAAANASRKYLLIENPSQTEDLWFNFTTTAIVGQPSILLRPNGSYVAESSYVSTEAISIIAATTAHPFVAKEG